jgi:hypothetical protein
VRMSSSRQLDADKGDADVDIDHLALVRDGVDDVSKAAGRRAVKIPIRLGCDGHESTPGSSLAGPWLLRPIECKPRPGATARGPRFKLTCGGQCAHKISRSS